MDVLLFLVLIVLADEFLRAYTLSRRSGFKFYLLRTAIWVPGFLISIALLLGAYTIERTTYWGCLMIGALLPSVVMGGMASRFREREIAKLQASSPEAWQRWDRALRDTPWIKRVFFQYPKVRDSAASGAKSDGRPKGSIYKYSTSGYPKNYTARISSLASELDLEKIKTSAEEVLRRAESKPAFCLGAIAYSDAHTLLLEIAAGLRKDGLAELLKRLETKLPVQVEQVGYGWLITGSPEQTTSRVSYIRHDPYTKATPQSEGRKVYTFDRRGLKRYLLSIGLLLVWLTLLIASDALRASTDSAFVLNLISIIGMMVFITMLGEGSLWPWAHTSRVVCDQEGLEIKYWLKPIPSRLPWTQISGLDMLSAQWSIRSNGRPLHLLASEGFGLNEGPTLAKTIIQRASLHYVESNMGVVIYKRFDAAE